MKRVWFLVFLILGCKAPRDNPYDPQSPNYKGEGTVTGKVTNLVGIPLKGAIISTIPVKFTAETDSNGSFVINPGIGNWKFVASLLGYVPETTQVEVAVADTKEVNFSLNGFPIVQSAKVISCHQHEGYPVGSIYWADISGEIADSDGIQDIDSVWVTVDFDTAMLKKYLSYKGAGIYTARIYGDSCPNKELESLIGRPFTIYAIDKKGTIGSSQYFYLSQIIYQFIYPLNPTSADTFSQGSPIEFVWTQLKVISPIVYRLTVLNSFTLDTVYTNPNILDTTITIDPLPQSKYRWRAEGRDGFGDISRSKAETFVVE